MSEGSCRRLLSGLGETRLPPEDLQPVCSRVPGFEGLCFGAVVASWLGLPRESDWKPFTPDKNFFMEAPVCVPQAMFCTLQTRPHLSQTGLDLKAMRRGFAQDGAVSVFAPQFPPRQPCLWARSSVAGGQLVISPHRDGSFISTEGSIDLV